MSAPFLLMMAAALCLITAAVHSVLGEQRLLAPLFAVDSPITRSVLAQRVLRFAWHWTSALWVLVGAVLALSAHGYIDFPMLIAAIGAVHLVAGIADGLLTRGRHIGWPLITIIGALALLATYPNL